MVEPPVTPKAYGGVVASPLANFGPGLERGTPYGTRPAPAAPSVGRVALSPTGGNDEKTRGAAAGKTKAPSAVGKMKTTAIPSTPIQETPLKRHLEGAHSPRPHLEGAHSPRPPHAWRPSAARAVGGPD